ncbi:proton-coupled zinc antiporter SLC30A1-like [Vipera latastei]
MTPTSIQSEGERLEAQGLNNLQCRGIAPISTLRWNERRARRSWRKPSLPLPQSEEPADFLKLSPPFGGGGRGRSANPREGVSKAANRRPGGGVEAVRKPRRENHTLQLCRPARAGVATETAGSSARRLITGRCAAAAQLGLLQLVDGRARVQGKEGETEENGPLEARPGLRAKTPQRLPTKSWEREAGETQQQRGPQALIRRGQERPAQDPGGAQWVGGKAETPALLGTERGGLPRTNRKLQMAAHLRKTPEFSHSCLPAWMVGGPGSTLGQLYLLVTLFLVEMVASRVTASLLLQACAFHTLEGTLALALRSMEARLGPAAGAYASWKNTFGWSRVPVAGTLVSAVLLSSLCLALLAEALRRLAEPRLTQHPLALMGIGALAIPIHLAREVLPWKARANLDVGACCSKQRFGPMGKQETEDLLGNGSSNHKQTWLVKEKEGDTASATGPWRTLYLGWMMACFGPVAVFLHSVMIYLWWTPCPGHATCLEPCPKHPCQLWATSEVLQALSVDCWLLYVDPGMAMVIAVAFLWLIWPALRVSALVLLQATPEGLDLWLLERRLQATEGVAAVQQLRVWQLDGCGRLVATAHVACLDVAAFGPVIQRVKGVFCEHGIHAVTVEPNLGMCPNEECQERSGQGPAKKQLCADAAEMREFETCV